MKTGKTVLMIDDDVDDQEIFMEVLNQIDPLIICLQALNAKLGLSLLLEEGCRPDFIFVDLNMPIMNGFEFLQEVGKHDHLRNIPIIMYTTSNENGDKKKAKMLGAAAFITKPSNPNVLKATLEAMLRLDHIM